MNAQERAAIQQALEALEAVDNDAHGTSFPATVSSAITDLLRAALAQKPEPAQEPVAQAMQDAAVYGVGISRAGKRIDPASIYEQPAQAPAYKVKVAGRWHDAEPFAAAFDLPDGEHLLYTAPPQRPPLTNEEMLDIIDDAFEGSSLLDVARAIERKVRGEA